MQQVTIQDHQCHKSFKYLIRHNHNATISQRVYVLVLFAMDQTDDLLDILDLLILHYLIVRRFADVEGFTTKGEDTEIVATDNTETGFSQSLGGVSFGQDESTLRSKTTSSVVGVGKLGEAVESSGDKNNQS